MIELIELQTEHFKCQRKIGVKILQTDLKRPILIMWCFLSCPVTEGTCTLHKHFQVYQNVFLCSNVPKNVLVYPRYFIYASWVD